MNKFWIKYKKVLFALFAVVILSTNGKIVFATELEENVETSEVLAQGDVIDIVYFSVSEDGELNILDSEIMSCSYLSDRIMGSFTFYDQGTKNSKHYYEVQMSATALDGVLFNYAKLSIKPKNNKEYIYSETHPKNTTFVNDAIQYSYSGDGPAVPTVSVKATFGTNSGSYSISARTLNRPIK